MKNLKRMLKKNNSEIQYVFIEPCSGEIFEFDNIEE